MLSRANSDSLTPTCQLYLRFDTFIQLMCDREARYCCCRTTFNSRRVCKCDVGVKQRRRSGEVCVEHLANSASQIPINMKLAQAKLLSGYIYTIRPAEKHSACAVNSHKTCLWHLLWEAGSKCVMW